MMLMGSNGAWSKSRSCVLVEAVSSAIMLFEPHSSHSCTTVNKKDDMPYRILDIIKKSTPAWKKKQKQSHANSKIKAGIAACTLSLHVCAEGHS